MRDPESSMAALPPCWKIPAIQEATHFSQSTAGGARLWHAQKLMSASCLMTLFDT
jgi:hypothetical protein